MVSRPPIGRMIELHRELAAGRFPNCRKLADRLEVSAKTIQRDIDFMRDRMGLPIEYDQLHFGFYYTEPVAAFPSMEVTEGELVALMVAQRALAQYEGTPFAAPLRRAFSKLTSGMEDKVRFGWEDVEGAISFRGLGASAADIEVFETASKAVLRQQEISFDYTKLDGKGPERRRVQPYHLACVENRWYLFAFDLARGQLRTFALARMRKAKNERARFRRPPDFSIDGLLRGSFGVFRGTGKFRVRIECDPFSARLIGECRWHDSQKITRLAGGRIEVRFDLDSLEEIERWVLGWGGHVKAVAPPALVGRIRATAASLAAAYGGPAAAGQTGCGPSRSVG
jgi:proteasome accessory factor B